MRCSPSVTTLIPGSSLRVLASTRARSAGPSWRSGGASRHVTMVRKCGRPPGVARFFVRRGGGAGRPTVALRRFGFHWNAFLRVGPRRAHLLTFCFRWKAKLRQRREVRPAAQTWLPVERKVAQLARSMSRLREVRSSRRWFVRGRRGAWLRYRRQAMQRLG